MHKVYLGGDEAKTLIEELLVPWEVPSLFKN